MSDDTTRGYPTDSRLQPNESSGEANLRTALAAMAEAVVIMDVHGKVAYFNDAWVHFHRLSTYDMVSRALEDFPSLIEVRTLDGEPISFEDWGIVRALRGESDSDVDIELRLTTTGERWYGRYNFVPIRDQAGGITGAVTTARDITEERRRALEHERLRTQIQQAQKMEAVGQLAGGIAHDFNNILAAVVGFGELARQRFAQDRTTKLAEYLDAIIAASERGRDLVAKMLTFSRVAPSGELQEVEVATVAREVTQLLSTIIPATIRFELQEQGPVPPVLMDATGLHQVLVNLVVNARDAIAEHGEIRLTVGGSRAHGARCSACQQAVEGLPVQITVADSGFGIDAAMVGRIFDPFFTTKETGKGTGMGLAVVHGLVHQAGGHIIVNSRQGHGTEFTLLFPAAPVRMSPQETGPAAPSPSASSLAGKRVLVVDDDRSIRNFLSDLLEGEGMHVTLASDGRAALALVEADPAAFDLVLTDQTMPEMTGVKLVDRMRELGCTVPALLLSGYGSEARNGNGEASGMRFLTKPAVPTEVLAAVRGILGQAG